MTRSVFPRSLAIASGKHLEEKTNANSVVADRYTASAYPSVPVSPISEELLSKPA